jgi:hypothetical protein
LRVALTSKVYYCINDKNLEGATLLYCDILVFSSFPNGSLIIGLAGNYYYVGVCKFIETAR